MTTTKLLYSREAYTLFNLLEDFGGFTGSIIMVFSLIVSGYSERMYQDSISRELPLQKNRFPSGVRDEFMSFLQKFQSPGSSTVETSDIATIDTSLEKA